MNNISDVASTLYQYFNSIDKAYLEGIIPEDAQLPYMTYSLAYAPDLEDTIIQVKVFDIGNSVKKINEITNKLSNDIGRGKVLKSKNGGIWIRKGVPFVQFVKLDKELANYINLEITYLGG